MKKEKHSLISVSNPVKTCEINLSEFLDLLGENPEQYHKLSASSVTAQLQMKLTRGFLKTDKSTWM